MRTMKEVPLAKPDFDGQELEAVRRVLESGWVVQGREVEAFEQAIAEMHHSRHCVAVSSGTAALHVAYLSLGIGPGDAVFVPSFAWPSAANMAVLVGARPVLVDVLPGTYNIDPDSLRREICRCLEKKWGRPRVVVPVHEFGLPAEMDEVLGVARRYELDIVEDAACALGAAYRGRPVGTLGSLGIFSFHPRKAITTGEGGAIITNDDALAEQCRLWRNHGQVAADGRRDFQAPGLNYRMTEIQAAIGRVQLSKFPALLQKRREQATFYLDELAGCPHVDLPAACQEHTWQTFMIVLRATHNRATAISRLAAEGIQTGPGSVAAHCAALYCRQFGYQPSDLPQSARLHNQGLALPLHSFLDSDDLSRCVALVASLPPDDGGNHTE
jgi:perosamine synthetase